MKRAMVLLSFTSLIFLVAVQALAQQPATAPIPLTAPTTPALTQIQVDKPSLPDGYESWPYKLVHTCQNIKESVWGKVDNKRETIEYIAVTEMNGKLISYIYAGSEVTEQKFADVYLQTNGKWLKFNSMNGAEDKKFQELQKIEFERNGFDNATYETSCQKFDNEFFSFREKLLDETSK